MRNRSLVLSAIFLIFLTSVALNINLNADTYVAQDAQLPILTVVKLTEKTSVSVGEKLTVTIIIKNIGNSTAYNISLFDARPGKWGAIIEGNTNMSWKQLPPNTEIVHSYNISIISASTYIAHLGRAKVVYYDNSSNMYVVYSENPSIYVQIKSGINIDWDKLWRDVTVMESIIVLILIVPLIIIEYNTYRSYKKEISKKK